MLVSVLVDRYQRVYSRKLFYNEEIINFHEYSDDENNDNESRTGSFGSKFSRSSTNEDPDVRAKEHASQSPDLEIENDENLIKPRSSRTHLILGYNDNENQEATRNLVERISTDVANKQLSGEKISFNIIPTDNNDEEDLTEINNGRTTKENVLKIFHRSLSPIDDQLNIPELKI